MCSVNKPSCQLWLGQYTFQISASVLMSPREHSNTIHSTYYILHITVPYIGRTALICHLLSSIALLPRLMLMCTVNKPSCQLWLGRYTSDVDTFQISASTQLSLREHSKPIRITSYIDTSPQCYITVPYTSRNAFICHLLALVSLLPSLMLMCTVNNPSCQLWLGRYTSEVETYQISASVQISTREHSNIIHITLYMDISRHLTQAELH